MKKALPLYAILMILSVLVAFLLNGNGRAYDYMTMFGLSNLLLGIVFGIAGAIVHITGNNITGKALMTAGGLLLLTGTATCSIFPINFNRH